MHIKFGAEALREQLLRRSARRTQDDNTKVTKNVCVNAGSWPMLGFDISCVETLDLVGYNTVLYYIIVLYNTPLCICTFRQETDDDTHVCD